MQAARKRKVLRHATQAGRAASRPKGWRGDEPGARRDTSVPRGVSGPAPRPPRVRSDGSPDPLFRQVAGASQRGEVRSSDRRTGFDADAATPRCRGDRDEIRPGWSSHGPGGATLRVGCTLRRESGAGTSTVERFGTDRRRGRKARGVSASRADRHRPRKGPHPVSDRGRRPGRCFGVGEDADPSHRSSGETVASLVGSKGASPTARRGSPPGFRTGMSSGHTPPRRASASRW